MIILPYRKTTCLDFPDDCEVKFFQLFMTLNKNYGATYMSYTFDRSNVVRFSFRSDSKWASIYHNEKILGKPMIESCPLDIASREKKNTFIIWDLYSHQSQPKPYKEIMGMREDIGLMHGLTLSTYFNGHHDAIAIASEDKKNDMANSILYHDNGIALKKSILACRTEILHFLNRKSR